MKGCFYILSILGMLFSTSFAYASPSNGVVDIPAAGATDRVRLPAREPLSACTVQAFSTNTGNVYVGDWQVTNASGIKRGIELTPGAALSDISVNNSNWLYIAADTAGDDVAFICN